MNILKFFAYIFYRFKKYYELWQAIIVFNALFVLNMMSIIMLYASYMDYSTDDFWLMYSTNNYFYNRLILGAVKVSPIFIITFVISIIFKRKLQKYYLEFKNETKEKQKTRTFGMWAYIVFTVIFFIFSIVSSSFL